MELQHSNIERLMKKNPLDNCVNVLASTHDLSVSKLKPIIERRNLSVDVVNDHNELDVKIEEIQRHIKYDKPFAQLCHAVKSIFFPISVSYQDFSLSFGKASVARKGSGKATIESDIVYIHENEIECSKLSQYLSFFVDIPPDSRPFFVIETKNYQSKLPEELSKCTKYIKVRSINDQCNQIRPANISDIDISSFANLFLSGAYSACVKSKFSGLQENKMGYSSENEIISHLSGELLRIRASDYEGNKFLSLPDAVNLLNSIDKCREYMTSESNFNKIMVVKSILNLWIAYIDEKSISGIENALAIAEHMGDDFLLAQGLRLTHLISGYSELTGCAVEKAVNIFQKNGFDEAFVYAKNNYLLNAMHIGKSPYEQFVDLANYSIETVPYLDRISTIFNNAGTSMLVAGRLDDAEYYYTKAARLNGQAIHRIGIELNLLAVRYMSGERINPQEVMKLHVKIKRAQLPKQFNYHQSYMHWNLLKISDFDRDVASEIYGYLRGKMFMNYESVLNGNCTMVDFLSKNMASAKKHGRFPGARGEFIHRTEIFPIIHFSWM